jgi:phospholipid/cholesterol/gamma-HCH transport system ATP-binding protein
VTPPVLALGQVVKNYGGLRPLRLERLDIRSGERVAISGIDATAAAVLVSIVTGAALPDEGTVQVFGRSTADIQNGDEWLASLDRFGIVSPRAVLLEDATLQQNLVMPFTLQIDPVPAHVARNVASLAAECGIATDSLMQPMARLPPEVRARAHFARAIALGPALLILEHPTADIPDTSRAAFGRDVAAAAQARGISMLAITLDAEFASTVAHRSLALNAATGALTPWKRRKWF